MIFLLPGMLGSSGRHSWLFLCLYTALWAAFCFVMSGMMLYFLFDWHRTFGEWQWHNLFFCGFFLVPAFGMVALSVLAFREHRKEKRVGSEKEK